MVVLVRRIKTFSRRLPARSRQLHRRVTVLASPHAPTQLGFRSREGEVLLVNGRQEPELELAGGQVERWRIVNAANTKYVRLSIGGRPFSIIGTDGGLLPEGRP